jgi:hypothetical protein
MLCPNLATQGKAQRVEHLHFKMIVGSIKIVAQMLNPYKFVFIGL